MLQHQLRIVIINLSMIIVKENVNIFFAINMCIVVYILCQQANQYASIHVHMDCTPPVTQFNIIFTHEPVSGIVVFLGNNMTQN